jgi:hypothetical protein
VEKWGGTIAARCPAASSSSEYIGKGINIE